MIYSNRFEEDWLSKTIPKTLAFRTGKRQFRFMRHFVYEKNLSILTKKNEIVIIFSSDLLVDLGRNL